MNIDMKRVDLLDPECDIENLLYHLARYKFVLRQLRPTDTVLEVGCGTGYGLHFLAKAAAQLDGVDMDDESIATAKRQYHRSNVHYAVQDIHTFPRESHYDVVICLEVIEHLDRDAALALLRRIKALKKPDGIAFISTPRAVPFEQRSRNRQIVHVHEYTIEELRQDLDTVFGRGIVLSQIDEGIGSANPGTAWNYVAVCK